MPESEQLLSSDELSQWSTTDQPPAENPSKADEHATQHHTQEASVALEFETTSPDERTDSAPPPGSSLETVLQWRERKGRDAVAGSTRRPGVQTADPRGPGRRSWLDETPLSTKPNPPGTKWGTSLRPGAKGLSKFDDRGGVSGSGLGWENVDQWNALRARAASPFISTSQRTSGFAANLNKIAEDSPGSGAYNLQNTSSVADSRRASTPLFSVGRGPRNDVLLTRSRRGRVSATFGTPFHSADVGAPYSSLDKQVLATKPSYKGVAFSQARRKGPGERSDTPGPGEYVVRLRVGDQRDHLQKTRMRQMPVHEFPRQKRPWQRDRDYKKDKPFGEARIRFAQNGQVLAQHPTPPAVKFSRAPRHGLKTLAMGNGGATGPGPGAYCV